MCFLIIKVMFFLVSSRLVCFHVELLVANRWQCFSWCSSMFIPFFSQVPRCVHRLLLFSFATDLQHSTCYSWPGSQISDLTRSTRTLIVTLMYFCEDCHHWLWWFWCILWPSGFVSPFSKSVTPSFPLLLAWRACSELQVTMSTRVTTLPLVRRVVLQPPFVHP